MCKNIENWFFVSETNDVEVEDIIRFDHQNNTYCIYDSNI